MGKMVLRIKQIKNAKGGKLVGDLAPLSIISVEKGGYKVEDGEMHASPTSVEELLTGMVEDGKPSFRLKWKPDDVYKSVFTKLKGSKFNLQLYFGFHDPKDDKVYWYKTPEAKKSSLKKAPINSGKGTSFVQTLDIKFDFLDAAAQ